MTELIKCECGGEGLVILYSWGEWSVICTNEKCFEETGFYATEAEAIEAWNERSGEK